MLNYNKIYLILATVAGANLFYNFLPKPLLLLLGVILLFLAAAAYGDKIAKKFSLLTKVSFGIIFIIGIAAFVGAVFFYVFSLNELAIILSLIIIFFKTRGFDLKKLRPAPSGAPPLPQLLYYIIAGALIILAYQARSSDLIKSLWQELPDFFLPLFFTATIILIILSHFKKDKNAVALHFFIFFGIAGLIYSLGYGFDQFIHEATQKHILEYGTITPKPFQYIGLYSINIFLHKITALPIETLNKFLLPVLTICIAPIGCHIFKKSNFIKNPVPMLAILLLPLSCFIVTTPQGLANLFLLIFIFLTIADYKKILLPLAILFIHPITGIIALTYFALLKLKFKKIITILGIFALPLAFLILSYKISGTAKLHFAFTESFKNYFNLLTFGGLKQNYNFWLDLFYLMQFLLLPVIIIISIWSARKFKKELPQYSLYLFWITTASFFLMKIFIDFSYLIGYEQKNYSERIFYISLLFLAPYLIFATQKIYSRLLKENIIYKMFFVLLFSFLLTSNFYLTYPRYDNYQNDKSKNVTQWMVRAVNKIKDDANNRDSKNANTPECLEDANKCGYVVLTDQTVSAAALKLDGFKKYYKTPLGEVFYYPIPTGGPLYNEFLNLVYGGTDIKAIENAKTLTGAKRAYVALPSYWENYEKIKERLKQSMQTLYEDENVMILTN